MCSNIIYSTTGIFFLFTMLKTDLRLRLSYEQQTFLVVGNFQERRASLGDGGNPNAATSSSIICQYAQH